MMKAGESKSGAAMRRPKLIPVVVAAHVIVATQVGRLLPPRTSALGQSALRTRIEALGTV